MLTKPLLLRCASLTCRFFDMFCVVLLSDEDRVTYKNVVY